MGDTACTEVDDIDAQWLRLFQSLDEASRRRLAGQRATEIGYGGLRQVIDLTGLSPHTIRRGIKELRSGKALSPDGRLRRPGGGRKKVEENDPEVVVALQELLNESTSGDPMRPLKWTTKSTRGLAKELTRRGHKVSSATVGRLLRDLGYSHMHSGSAWGSFGDPHRIAGFRSGWPISSRRSSSRLRRVEANTAAASSSSLDTVFSSSRIARGGVSAASAIRRRSP